MQSSWVATYTQRFYLSQAYSFNWSTGIDLGAKGDGRNRSWRFHLGSDEHRGHLGKRFRRVQHDREEAHHVSVCGSLSHRLEIAGIGLIVVGVVQRVAAFYWERGSALSSRRWGLRRRLTRTLRPWL